MVFVLARFVGCVQFEGRMIMAWDFYHWVCGRGVGCCERLGYVVMCVFVIVGVLVGEYEI